MSLRFQLAATLFSVGLPMMPAAHGQSCTEMLRNAASHRPSYTVSVSELRIPEKARQHLEKARATSENNPTIFDRETAQALAVAPRFAGVYLLRAEHELHLGHAEAAIEAVAMARQIEPHLSWSYVILASALNHLHRFREAAAELDRAPREEAGTWEAWYERARTEAGMGNVGAALHFSELVLGAAPVGCTDAHLLRANALQVAGRQPEALGELETYLALDRRGKHRDEVLAAIARARLATEQSLPVKTQQGDDSLLAMK